MFRFIALLAVIAPINAAFGQTPVLDSAFQSRSIELDDKTEYKYAVFLPKAYRDEPEKKWPVILFLHGSGERGTDGVKQTTIGLPAYIARHRSTFEFITIMPQAHTMWFTGDDEVAVWKMLEREANELRIDPERVYITGLSMGGFATWDFICKRPDVFAAAVPVCGSGNPKFVSNAKSLPIWAFHGVNDKAVPVSGSREPIETLKKSGANPIYTEYADGDHFIWDRAYQTQRLYSWLLEHKRQPPPRRIDYQMLTGTARVWWLNLVADPKQTEPPLLSAIVNENNEITLTTKGVIAWAIASDREPIAPGTKVDVKWNGKLVFNDTFTGILALSPKSANESTTQPATDSKDAADSKSKSAD